MKLQEIREIVKNTNLDKLDCRSATKDFVRSIQNNYQVALTLTLKQSWYNKNGQMRVKHYLSESDIPKIYERFEHKLNKLIYKNQYTRFKKSVKIFKTWENGHGSKRIHLHAALGNFPKNFRFNTLPHLIKKACTECYEFDVQHDEKLCDGDWLEYITKEVGKYDTDKILW